MRSLTDAEKEIIAKHALWLRDEVGGARANLNCANLDCANLDHANLNGASLDHANLNCASLNGASLNGANLDCANLDHANLDHANLDHANLDHASLNCANLNCASLNGASLNCAKNADLAIAITRILPEGTLIGWKKCQGGVIVKLEIPADARRSSAFGRKCRAEFARVLEVIGAKEGVSNYSDAKSPVIHYRVGEIVRPATPFCKDFTQECAAGVHFYVTRLEADSQ